MSSSSEEDSSSTQVFHLTASQVAYLKEKGVVYSEANAKEREEIEKKSSDHLVSELEELTGSKVSREKRKLLKAATTEWFRQHLAAQTSGKARRWGIKWHGRLVFQYEKGNAINHLARLMAADEELPDLRQLLEGENDSVEGDGDTQNLPFNDDQGAARKVFTKYQLATTALWNVLTEEEQARYRSDVETFRKSGPPLETRRLMAKRFALQRCHEFAETMLNELDAVVYMLVGFQDPSKKPLAVECEFTEELCGARGQTKTRNFKDMYKRRLKDSGLMDDWANYVGSVYLDEGEEDQATVFPATHRTNKKPLADLETNTYGEPLLPSLRVPPGVQKGVWLIKMMRTYWTMSYGISMGLPPGTRHDIPWRRIAKSPHDFISDTLPPNLMEAFFDPGSMSVSDLEKCYLHIYVSQDKSDGPAFEFTAYEHKKGDVPVPRAPRKKNLPV
ncbi:hypothetical protein BKA70DRAFT_1131752 [Coprinopsis sp. MPI-PUGE-AT-0042]|nr:hypothetical protein BKA70DRAFT_1131752 [Coprinopsis sp. MPI-PUGE-AT-0042]